MIEATWRLGTPGHSRLSVPLGETAELERIYAAGRQVNVFHDDRPTGWIRVMELRRVDEREGEAVYLVTFAACEPPTPPSLRAGSAGTAARGAILYGRVGRRGSVADVVVRNDHHTERAARRARW